MQNFEKPVHILIPPTSSMSAAMQCLLEERRIGEIAIANVIHAKDVIDSGL
jgi:hypothetical protein